MTSDSLTAAGSVAAIIAALVALSPVCKRLWQWVRNPGSSPPVRAVAWVERKRGIAVGREATGQLLLAHGMERHSWEGTGCSHVGRRNALHFGRSGRGSEWRRVGSLLPAVLDEG